MLRKIITILKLTSNNIQKIIEIGNKMLEIQREISEHLKKMNWEDEYIRGVSEVYKNLNIIREEDWGKGSGSNLPS
jgi:hypothetical protein